MKTESCNVLLKNSWCCLVPKFTYIVILRYVYLLARSLMPERSNKMHTNKRVKHFKVVHMHSKSRQHMSKCSLLPHPKTLYCIKTHNQGCQNYIIFKMSCILLNQKLCTTYRRAMSLSLTFLIVALFDFFLLGWSRRPMVKLDD